MVTLNQSLTTPRTDLSLSFEQFNLDANRAGFVGFKIAPAIEGQNQFDRFPVLKKSEVLRAEADTARNPDGSYKSIEAMLDFDTYATEDHGLEAPLDDRRGAMYRQMINADLAMARLLRYMIMEAHERRVIAKALADARQQVVAAPDKWNDPSVRVTEKMNDYIQQFRLQCGVSPTGMVIDEQMVNILMENDSVLEKFVGSGDRTAEGIRLRGLAAALKLDEIVVSKSVKNVAVRPKEASLESHWPVDKALLYVSDETPDTLTRQFMRTIHWGADGSQVGGVFEQYPNPKHRGSVLRNRMDTAEKTLDPDAGLVLDGIYQ